MIVPDCWFSHRPRTCPVPIPPSSAYLTSHAPLFSSNAVYKVGFAASAAVALGVAFATAEVAWQLDHRHVSYMGFWALREACRAAGDEAKAREVQAMMDDAGVSPMRPLARTADPRGSNRRVVDGRADGARGPLGRPGGPALRLREPPGAAPGAQAQGRRGQ